MKRLKSLAAVCGALLLLSGCGTTQETAEEPLFTTLTVAVRSGERGGMRDITADFQAENPNVNLKIMELGSDFDQYHLLTAAFSSEQYLFDVAEIEDAWTDDFAANGYIVPLSENIQIDSDYFPMVRDSFIRQGQVYAVPFQMDVGMLFALRSYEWDGGFDGLSEAARGVQKQGPENMDTAQEEFICSLMELIRYTDGDIGRALELFRDIYRNKDSEQVLVGAFKKGEIPAIRAWSSVTAQLRSDSSEVAGEFQIYNTPKSMAGQETSVAKVFGMAVSALSPQRELCEKFAEYCGRDRVQAAWVRRTGVYPVKESLYQEPGIVSNWNHIQGKEQVMKNAALRPHTVGYVDRADDLQGMVQAFLEGRAALEETEEALREFFRQENSQ